MEGGAISGGEREVMPLTGVARRLVNGYQRGLPLVPRPFERIAARLEWDESAVIRTLRELVGSGVVSRVGPVIRPNTVGVSTLAAIAVPASRLESVAGLVNACPEVNHNYEREHRFNLWFVVTAADEPGLNRVIAGIEAATGLAVMVLPMLEDYYIDLGFDLDGAGTARSDEPAGVSGYHADEIDKLLLQLIQDGLPLVSRPFERIAVLAGLPEREVLARLRRLVDSGVVKRLGIVVRHHECGFRHNAMAVWDVADEHVRAAGRRLAGMESVRLCYRRPRRLPDWPYNLFCMVHGRERGAVCREIARMARETGLDRCPGDILFSTRRFKQRGARYVFDQAGSPARATA